MKNTEGRKHSHGDEGESKGEDEGDREGKGDQGEVRRKVRVGTKGESKVEIDRE